MDNRIPQLEDGFTKIANDILDALCKINIPCYQRRVLDYIIRRTYGFNKKDDWISISQIIEGTGLKQSHASRAKKELLLRRLIYTSTGIKVAFQKDSRLWRDIPLQVYKKNIPLQVKNIPVQVSNIPLQVSKYTSTGEHKIQLNTITKYNIQKTIPTHKKYSSLNDLCEETLNEIAEKYQVPVAFVQSKLDDMTNWLEAKGRKYKNYKAALSNWVKSDALKIVQRERQVANKFRPTEIKV